MLEKEAIVKLIIEFRDEVRDIENIPEILPSQEKAVKLEARQRLSKFLGYLIEIIEGKGSTGEKKVKHELLP